MATFYELSDGRVQAEVSAAPVRYRDADGRLRDIDTTVVASGRDGVAFENVTNTFTSYFGTSTDQLAAFELDGRRVSLGVAGTPVGVDAAADGDTVTFAGVFGPGVDVAYEVTGDGVEGADCAGRSAGTGLVHVQLGHGRPTGQGVGRRVDRPVRRRVGWAAGVGDAAAVHVRQLR
jgi:hypothetical protein